MTELEKIFNYTDPRSQEEIEKELWEEHMSDMYHDHVKHVRSCNLDETFACDDDCHPDGCKSCNYYW